MIAPTKDTIITSPFGPRENPPGNHPGIDLRAKNGAEIFAPEDVTVLRFGTGHPYGEHFVVLKGRETNSVHKIMHCLHTGVVVGVTFQEGMVIAMSDNSGTRDAHCHWELWKGGAQDGWSGEVVDPVEYYLEMYGIPFDYSEELKARGMTI